MTEILKLIKDAFENAKISNTFYEAKKIINKLGLNYTKIPACPNDCMLYWGEDEDLQECKRCKTSKWSDAKENKPAKILRYFPLKLRLQRLFMCSKTVQSMRWHASAEKKDSKMRHPRDSEAWKTFDLLHDRFAEDPRNIRLGLAADGFNPFGAMCTNYSVWPMVLIPYNRPPWECMKPTSLILSMIILGEKMPENNIDVYLQLFIKELKELKHGGKWCFLGHRRFLERGHKFRLSRAKFNRKVELRDSPAALTESEILEQLEGINVSFGKELHANKDVMHIEKNVCDNVLYTLLNETGRSKDIISKLVRILKKWNIRVPDGLSSNISRCVDLKQRKLSGLKSHDCYVLMQQLLPISIRNVLPDKLMKQNLEDQYFGHLKFYVRNKAKSEGSIAEGYVAEEALTFCSRYLERIETRFNRPPRVDDCPDGNYSTHVDSLFSQMGNSKGTFTAFEFDFKDFVRRRSKGRKPSNVKIEKRVNKDFVTWFPTQGLDQESEIPSPKELGSRSSGANNKEA
ncbi:uncharacterized protein [Arachis hypogaea]|uniref:uncharacterized protein n=1 Tax=Arachis hypogaea TaxID=3818 RepID=UPI003B20FA40